MFTVRQYVRATSLHEAWELNGKRVNSIIGGMGWMKMTRADLSTAIDLSDLGLDTIEETADEFIIGAMTTLRSFELHEGFNEYFNNAAREAVRHIVGVQFRNCATIGGSVWLRPGFSDIITLLQALDTSVELYSGTDMHEFLPLNEFVMTKKDNSIIVAVHVKKDGRKVSYKSFRNTETDFPVLAVAVSKKDNIYTAGVGARPSVARAVSSDNTDDLKVAAAALTYSKNIRGSAEYRRMLSGVLIDRALKELD